jgi:hypothetical protein
LAALASLGFILPTMVLAATVQDLIDLAKTKYSFACTPTSADVTCVNRLGTWQAVITPASGPETNLTTQATINTAIPATGMDAAARAWMSDMHALACGDPKGVAAYVDLVGNLTKSGSGPTVTIGNCRFNGGFAPFALTAGGRWTVGSSVIPPPSPSPTPTAGPTASPTPAPTPTPTAKPTLTPTPKPTPTPAQSLVAAQTLAPTAAPTPHETAAASALPSLPPTVDSTVAPTIAPTPSPLVEPATGSSPPATEPPVGGVTPAPTPVPTPPTFESSVLGIVDVNADTTAIGGSLLLALLLLLLIGFAGELFNNTIENNYDEISGWFRKGPLGWLRRLGGKLAGEARIGLLLFLGVTAFVSSFVDPHFGIDVRSLGEFLGFLVGLVVVLASFKLPPMLAHKRKTGELGRLRPLPWALAIAALFVLVSRLGNLQPGYLYGIVLGAIFVNDVSDKEEGRETFYGSLWTLAAAFLAWLALTWARSLGYDPNGFGITLLTTAFAAILVAGLEATAFGLMPLRFMPGHAVYRWNRLGWALLFGLSVFGFVHILIGPSSGYVSQLSPQGFVAALGVFAAFGALSIVTWGYFRFRPQTVADSRER